MTRFEGRDPTAALGFCLEQLEAGRPLDDVLRPYPDWAAELRPLLQTATALRQLPVTAAPAEVAARIADALNGETAKDRAWATRLRAATSAILRRREPAWARAGGAGGTSRLRLAPRLAAGPLLYGTATLVALLLLAAGAARASADSVPGGALYPVKRGLERLHMLVVSSSAEAQLAARLAERRLEEAAALEAAGRSPAPALAGLGVLDPWAEGFPAPLQTAVAAARERSGGEPGGDDAATPGTVRGATPEAASRATVVERRGQPASDLLVPPPPTRLAAERLAAAAATAVTGAGPTGRARQPSTAVAGSSSPRETGPPAAVPVVAETAPRPGVTPAATEWTAPTTAVTAPQEDPPPAATGAPAVTPEPSEVPATVAATSTAVEPRAPGWDVVVGVVMSARGGGLGRAQVSFVDAESGERVVSVATRGDGAFQQRLRAGRYLVVATAEGHRQQWFRGRPSREGAHPVVLPGEGGQVTVRFLLQPVQPLSRDATPQRPEPPPTATTDAEPTAVPEPTAEAPP